MSEIKFACPTCQQHIQCDVGYSGREIDCPACHAKMIVPQTEAPAPAPAPAPVAALRTSSAPSGSTCPGCGAVLAPAAVLCTSCGFNLKTGQRLAPRQSPTQGQGPRGAKKKKRPRPSASQDAPWYRTVYPYAGAFGLLMLVLYLVGQSNDVAMFGYAVLGLLYIVAIHITVVIYAFKEDGVGPGIGCFCIELYKIYYVFSKSESTIIRTLYGLSLLIEISFYFLKDIG